MLLADADISFTCVIVVNVCPASEFVRLKIRSVALGSHARP